MQIRSTNNRCNILFGSGNVTLRNINPGTFLRYGDVERIAKENKLDIFISKSEESEYLALNDLYTIIAKRDILNGSGDIELPINRTNCVLTDKNASAKEVSDKLYETVLGSIESLAKNIETRFGGKINFLKNLIK